MTKKEFVLIYGAILGYACCEERTPEAVRMILLLVLAAVCTYHAMKWVKKI